MTAAANDGVATWMVGLTAAAMGFLAGLALTAVAGADELAARWTQSIERRATITLDIDHGDAAPSAAQTLARALAIVEATPGVREAEALDVDATRALLADALGRTLEDVADLPVPPIIDVGLSPSARSPIEALERRLAAIGLDATVDAHEAWAQRVGPAAARIRALAGAALTAVALASSMMMTMATATALSAHARTVRVLALVGARDGAIAQLFERRLQLWAFGGATLGVAMSAVGVALAAENGADGVDALGLSIRPSPADWARLAILPLAFAAIATAATRGAVAWTLRRAEP